MPPPFDPGPTALDEVIAPVIPGRLAAQQPAETAAFLRLSTVLARRPDGALQQLVDDAMELTRAGSAGLSLEELGGEEPIFRWVATAGEFARYAGGTMPRYFSPCGAVLDRRKTLLMRDPARHYPYVASLHVPIRSVLLTPFARSGRFIGTVWAIHHDGRKSFTTNDQRIVEGLATFAGSILDAIRRTH